MSLSSDQVLIRLSAVKVLRDSVSDEDASKIPGIFPQLKQKGTMIHEGTRVKYKGKIYKAKADVLDTNDNSPKKSPELWEELKYKNGVKIKEAADEL